MRYHASTFQFQKLPSNANSFHTLNTLSASSMCTYQLPTCQRWCFCTRECLQWCQRSCFQITRIFNSLVLFISWGMEHQIKEKRSSSIPVTIILVVMPVLFEMTMDNISQISWQSTTFSSATQLFNSKLPT